MFNSIKNFLGVVTAREIDDLIIIEGVPSYFIQKDIEKIWKTNKLTKNTFKKITKNSFTFHKFFTIDIIYIFNEFLSNRKVGASNARTAKKILDAIYENTWIKNTKLDIDRNLDFSKQSLFYKTPLDYQKEFFDKYNKITAQYNLKGYLLNAAAGSGKTYTNLLLAEMLNSDYVVVVCPINSLYRVWEASIKNEYKIPPTYWIENNKQPYANQKYIVVHYESLQKLLDLDIVSRLKGKITIILDECHNLNEIQSLRTNLFIKLCKSVENRDVIWASGTPIKALGSESIPLLLTIDPYFTDEVLDDFKSIYGKNATKATDILNNRLNLISKVVEKKELNLLPPIIENIKVKTANAKNFTLNVVKKLMDDFIKERLKYYQSISEESHDFYFKCLNHCEQLWKLNKSNNIQKLSELDKYKRYVEIIKMVSDYSSVKEEMKFCSDYEKNIIIPLLPAEWRDRFKDVKSIVKYVGLKIQGECLGRVLGKQRMECIKEICEGLDFVPLIESTTKKTLIFTSYVEVLERCKDRLIELEQKPLAVYGKTNKDLNDIIEKFDKDETLNPLVATYASLSTAVPLTMADNVIMINVAFRDYIHQQAISRIHRLGSNTQVYVRICSLDTGEEPNLSSRTIDILKWSQEQVAAITGVKSPFEIETNKIALEKIDENFIDDYMYLEPSTEEFFIDPTLVKELSKPFFSNW